MQKVKNKKVGFTAAAAFTVFLGFSANANAYTNVSLSCPPRTEQKSSINGTVTGITMVPVQGSRMTVNRARTALQKEEYIARMNQLRIQQQQELNNIKNQNRLNSYESAGIGSVFGGLIGNVLTRTYRGAEEGAAFGGIGGFLLDNPQNKTPRNLTSLNPNTGSAYNPVYTVKTPKGTFKVGSSSIHKNNIHSFEVGEAVKLALLRRGGVCMESRNSLTNVLRSEGHKK